MDINAIQINTQSSISKSRKGYNKAKDKALFNLYLSAKVDQEDFFNYKSEEEDY